MNPNLASFAQAVQPSAPPPMPGFQGGMPPMQGPSAAPQQQGGPQQGRFTPQELAGLGRMGDTLIAHLTPGEIEVPPQVQTPKVLATLKQAYDKAGVNIDQFTAGSPQTSTNPQSGVPEYSFWSALLPIVGAVAGSVVPGIGTAAGAALGGAAGGALGGGIDHGWSGALRGGLIGGATGYLGGSAFAGAGGAANAAGGAAAGGAADAGAVAGTTAGSAALTGGVPASALGAAVPAVEAAGPVGASTALSSTAMAPNYVAQFANWVKANPVKAATVVGMGATIAPSLFQKTQGTPPLPASMTAHMPGVNSLGNYNQQLGNSNAVSPHFNGYSPSQSVTGDSPYNFFSS